MIFDRISLVIAYTSLKVVELNEAPVKDILFNKTAYYGTKTIERFKTLNDAYMGALCSIVMLFKGRIWKLYLTIFSPSTLLIWLKC